MGVAAKSNVEKRQVGCIITYGDTRGPSDETICGSGFNDEDNHAEYNAVEDMQARAEYPGKYAKLTAYVTHPPCPECATLLASAGITDIEIVDEFMKFDSDKLRYDLIVPEFITTHGYMAVNEPLTNMKLRLLHSSIYMSSERAMVIAIGSYKDFAAVEGALAKVLTDGASKYKKDNWKLCNDPGRYVAAAIRHSRALSLGELIDPESGSPHMDHIITNLMFIFYFQHVQNRP